MAISFAVSIFYYRDIFNFILLIIGILMLVEWREMTRSNSIISFLGIPIITIPIISLLAVSNIDKSGWILFGYFCTVWSVDTAAMIVGKTLQGPKLAPRISPNKTITGLLGGCIGAGICVNILYYFSSMQVPDMHLRLILVIYAIVFAILSQMSDLFISIFKRKFNIKDTGKLIPGHGGFLDRFDSIILTAPVLAAMIVNF
jgi:phosphatidate cytidylyltransferase